MNSMLAELIAVLHSHPAGGSLIRARQYEYVQKRVIWPSRAQASLPAFAARNCEKVSAHALQRDSAGWPLVSSLLLVPHLWVSTTFSTPLDTAGFCQHKSKMKLTYFKAATFCLPCFASLS